MRRIRSADMKPERQVRSLIHRLGYRFRLHAKDLPGKPDIVFRTRRKVVFVHGCFWHQHEGCADARTPKSNVPYWRSKLQRNSERDARVLNELSSAGWGTLVIWECEVHRVEELKRRISSFL